MSVRSQKRESFDVYTMDHTLKHAPDDDDDDDEA